MIFTLKQTDFPQQSLRASQFLRKLKLISVIISYDSKNKKMKNLAIQTHYEKKYLSDKKLPKNINDLKRVHFINLLLRANIILTSH